MEYRVTRQNPDLAFVHGPGFDGPGVVGVRVKVTFRVWIRVRVRVGVNGPGFDR